MKWDSRGNGGIDNPQLDEVLYGEIYLNEKGDIDYLTR